MPGLAINTGNVVSPPCRSVLKIELYAACPYPCVHRYGEWYVKGSEEVAPGRAAKYIRRRAEAHVVQDVDARGSLPAPEVSYGLL